VPTGAEARTRFDRSAGDSSPDSDSDSLEDALARARGHAQAAVAEALAAISALLDAASLASSGELARSNGILAPATRILEGLRSQLGGGQDHESLHLIQSIAEALDAEIARWEDRARDDADARAVLRAFLGLRELLWEFGVRTGEKSATRGPSRPKKARAKSSTQRKNVQRVTVEG
jgi:hypothetical protein